MILIKSSCQYRVIRVLSHTEYLYTSGVQQWVRLALKKNGGLITDAGGGFTQDKCNENGRRSTDRHPIGSNWSSPTVLVWTLIRRFENRFQFVNYSIWITYEPFRVNWTVLFFLQQPFYLSRIPVRLRMGYS